MINKNGKIVVWLLASSSNNGSGLILWFFTLHGDSCTCSLHWQDWGFMCWKKISSSASVEFSSPGDITTAAIMGGCHWSKSSDCLSTSLHVFFLWTNSNSWRLYVVYCWLCSLCAFSVSKASLPIILIGRISQDRKMHQLVFMWTKPLLYTLHIFLIFFLNPKLCLWSRGEVTDCGQLNTLHHPSLWKNVGDPVVAFSCYCSATWNLLNDCTGAV